MIALEASGDVLQGCDDDGARMRRTVSRAYGISSMGITRSS